MGTTRWFQPGEGLHDCEMKERSTEKSEERKPCMRCLPEGGDGSGVVGGGGGARQRGQELAPGGHPVIPPAPGRGRHTYTHRIMALSLLHGHGLILANGHSV